MALRHLVALAVLLCSATLHAQTTAADLAQDWAQGWAHRLTGHPLYLRDAWTDDKLDFNASGEPATEAHHGALTLSGIDITCAGVDELLLQAFSQFNFQPATLQGQPVTAGFQFRLQLGRAPSP